MPDDEMPERRELRVTIPREVWKPAAAQAMRDLRASSTRRGVCTHGGVQARCSFCRIEVENVALRDEVTRLRAILHGEGYRLDHPTWHKAHSISAVQGD